jgi:hypothetical protein
MKKPIRYARSTDSDKGPFIASSLPIRKLMGNRFHRWDCKYVKGGVEGVKGMELKNRIMFKTHKEAVAAGRKPCLTCRP